MTCCREPTLEEMLADPIVQALIAADRVDPGALEEMLRGIGEARRSDGPHRAAPSPSETFMAWEGPGLRLRVTPACPALRNTQRAHEINVAPSIPGPLRALRLAD